MSFTDEQKAALSAPLDKSVVAQREQAGRKLSYIEAWHAIAEANRIFGFDAWDRETVEMRLLGEPRQTGDKSRVGYFAKVRVTVRTADGVIVREGSGFGSGIDKDVDQAHESALKEAESDAMKRALMTFGNPFGLALYDKTQANVAVAPPPIPPRETGIFQACKAAIDLSAEQGGEAGLDTWVSENTVSMGKIKDDNRPVYDAIRAYYAEKRRAVSQKVAA